MPSGPPTPIGGAQTINPSLLRNSSGRLVSGAQVELVGSQPLLPSLVSQRGQFGNYGNMSVLGSISNVNSLMSNNFSNGVFGLGTSNSSIPMNLQQHNSGEGVTGMVGSAEPDPLQNFQNPSGNQLRMEHSLVEASSQSIHQQFSFPQGPQQSLVGGLGSAAPVKIEQQMSSSDQLMSLQQLPSLRNLSSVKLEGQQLQHVRNLGPVKLDQHQQPDPSFLQHQQEQQVLHSLRQTSQTAAPMNLQQQQQRISQMQQQQQQQLLKTLPQQKQALNLGSQAKSVSYEPGICSRRLTHYMYHQQHRPADNNIEFWRKFVKEYFAPHAKKRWCVSLYGNGRQTNGVFPQDVWHCEICKRKPGRGFETTVEVLPRLLKIKYDSGPQEELLYVDMPREYQNALGQIVLDYAKAIQESVFEQLRVVRDGQLRVVFSSDLKICSWEFCARRHEELIPRRLIVPHVSELGLVAQKYQTSTQNDSSNANLSSQDLQNTCNAFVTSACQMAKLLEVPLVNDLGYTKRYVRCLQISEVVNSMKDLIDYSRETGTSPMTSLVNFPQRSTQSGVRIPPSQQVQKQLALDITGINSSATSGMQTSAADNGTMSLSNISSHAVSPTTSASAIAGLLHQNSMNLRQENPINNFSNLYSGRNTMRVPSTGSSNSIPQSQPDSSPFLSAAPSTPNNHAHISFHNNTSHLNPTNSSGNVSSVQQPVSQPNDAKPNNAQSSMHQIMQEMMMSSQCNGPSMSNDTISVGGIPQPLNGGNYLAGNHNTSMGIGGFRMTGANGSTVTASGIRAALANSTMSLNVGVGMKPVVHDQSLDHRHQLVVGNRLLSNGLNGLSMLNGHSNGQFDWKQTP